MVVIDILQFTDHCSQQLAAAVYILAKVNMPGRDCVVYAVRLPCD
jgi:hypothetical protein